MAAGETRPPMLYSASTILRKSHWFFHPLAAGCMTELWYNGETGRNYNGVNRFVLLLKAMEQSWSDPRYYTFHQVNQMEGCHVRAGEKATGVDYWLLFKSHYEKIMAVNKDAMAGV